MSSNYIDQLVSKYLKSKGHDNIAKIIEESKTETKKNDSSESSFKDTELFSLCEDIVIDGINEGDYKKSLLDTYSIFTAWASDSLDFLKPELCLLCLPIFSYSYICLIRKGLNTDALIFWKENSKKSPDISILYSKEVSELAMLLESDQLQNPNFLRNHHFIKSVMLLVRK